MKVSLWGILSLLIGLSSSMAIEVNDRYLSSYMNEQNEGIIYLWSPGMPLSVMGISEAKKIAADLKISFLAVSDKNSPVTEDFNLETPLNAHTLIKKGIYDHFPAIVVFKDGELLPKIIHGYEKPEGLKNLIQKQLNGSKL